MVVMPEPAVKGGGAFVACRLRGRAEDSRALALDDDQFMNGRGTSRLRRQGKKARFAGRLCLETRVRAPDGVLPVCCLKFRPNVPFQQTRDPYLQALL